MYINGGKAAWAVFLRHMFSGTKGSVHPHISSAIIHLGRARTGTWCAWGSAGDELAAALDVDNAGSRLLYLAPHQVIHPLVGIYRSDDI